MPPSTVLIRWLNFHLQRAFTAAEPPPVMTAPQGILSPRSKMQRRASVFSEGEVSRLLSQRKLGRPSFNCCYDPHLLHGLSVGSAGVTDSVILSLASTHAPLAHIEGFDSPLLNDCGTSVLSTVFSGCASC